MPSYVVAGVSRGIGFETIRQLSENPSNTVIGLARNVESTKEKVAAEINRPNIHILHADLDNYKTFPDVVAATSKITDGKLDYLIGNAAIMGNLGHLPISELGKDPEAFDEDLMSTFRTNAVSYAHLINAFMPLVLLGDVKKVILISTGMADTELIRKHNVWMGFAYAVSKAALNMIVAKASADYQEKGVLILAISPGFVATSDMSGAPDFVLRSVEAMVSKFTEYEPSFKGPLTPEESVKHILSVIEMSSIENGNAGDFLSHLGTKRWL